MSWLEKPRRCDGIHCHDQNSHVFIQPLFFSQARYHVQKVQLAPGQGGSKTEGRNREGGANLLEQQSVRMSTMDNYGTMGWNVGQ